MNNKIEANTMQVKIPFDDYLKEKQELSICKVQNEAFKKATKGLVIVLAEKPKNLSYTSYSDISKLNFLDVRYEGVYEFMRDISENLKKLTDERVKKLLEESEKKDQFISKLEYKIKKYSDESGVIKSNESLIKKVASLQQKKDDLEKEIKASNLSLEKESDLKKQIENLELKEKNGIEDHKRVCDQLNITIEKLKAVEKQNKQLNEICTYLKLKLNELDKNYLIKFIKFLCKKKNKM